ncbi:MAG: hypothetical protein IKN55_03370 [Oscillospiraceae bacterium]|nr:hypothetical protein [Oscillospiraceae bacterium]
MVTVHAMLSGTMRNFSQIAKSASLFPEVLDKSRQFRYNNSIYPYPLQAYERFMIGIYGSIALNDRQKPGTGFLLSAAGI